VGFELSGCPEPQALSQGKPAGEEDIPRYPRMKLRGKGGEKMGDVHDVHVAWVEVAGMLTEKVLDMHKGWAANMGVEAKGKAVGELYQQIHHAVTGRPEKK